MGHPVQVLKPVVGNCGVVEAEILEACQSSEMCEPLITDVGAGQVEGGEFDKALEMRKPFVGDVRIAEVEGSQILKTLEIESPSSVIRVWLRSSTTRPLSVLKLRARRRPRMSHRESAAAGGSDSNLCDRGILWFRRLG